MKKPVQILILSGFLLTFIVTKQLNVMQDTEEIWKDVVGYEGLYSVSNEGQIKHSPRNRLKTPIKNWAGYMRIQLWKNNVGKIYSIHRLVAIAFIPNPENLKEINHIDHNRGNNYLSNLEWCSRSYNAKHSFLRPDRKKARYWLGKSRSEYFKNKKA